MSSTTPCDACGIGGWYSIEGRCGNCGHRQGNDTDSRPNGFGVL